MQRELQEPQEELAVQLCNVRAAGNIMLKLKESYEVRSAHSSQFRRLTDSELQAKRAKGLCYRCDKKFAPGHRCPSQSLHVLLVDESDGSEEEAAPELQVKRWDPGAKID
ncbi:hypothetical protein Tco_0629158 [Tanacetum coccineum]|uniref:Uncharacterized protein n=1 Tax=Tanacetum coccineum TaxID=301880 RepID=A0ABQ4WSC9_9ASTR